MVDDIIFYGREFYLDLPLYSSGIITRIEAQSNNFELRLALPPRISIS